MSSVAVSCAAFGFCGTWLAGLDFGQTWEFFGKGRVGREKRPEEERARLELHAG